MRGGVWLRRGLCLADIGIERRFGDPHELADLFHRDLFLLVELHRQLPFVCLEHLWAPTEASAGSCDAQACLGALLDQLPFKLG